jgi:DNA repair exonuclease SbcCD ATPase subunit
VIERLELTNWRSFDRLTVSFDTGTTFIVAPNGVGKTSLLLAVSWGLFGADSAIDASECIRAGAESATVSVSVRLPNALPLAIKREVQLKGRMKSQYLLDGRAIEETEAIAELESMFGTSLAVAARLSTMAGSDSFSPNKPLDVRGHLFEAFGVSNLVQNADSADLLAKELIKRREGIRSASRTLLENREADEERAAALDAEVAELDAKQADLRSTLQGFEDIERNRELWRRYDNEQEKRAHEFVQLRENYEQILAGSIARDTSPDEFLSVVETKLLDIQADLESTEADLINFRVKLGTASSALELLAGDDPACPTCLRAFHANEHDSAVNVQREISLEAKANIDIADERLRVLRSKVEALHSIRHKLQLLVVPLEEPTGERPVEDVTAREELMDRLLAIQSERIDKLNVLKNLRQGLESDAETRRLLQQEELAYEQEAKALSLAHALRASADEIVAAEIEPLTDQIKWRWKLLFHNEGLQFRADGSFVRNVGERELSWSTLSGGERIWARLVAHLAVISASTTVPFAWFDEPLEHLAPEARRSVASALSHVTETGPLHQVVVTTYEHAIARQNAADVESANVIYLRNASSGVIDSTA